MAATMVEPAKPPQREVATLQGPRAALPRPDGAFDWEERAHSGDEFAFQLWVIGYLVLVLLAVSDWLRAILGW